MQVTDGTYVCSAHFKSDDYKKRMTFCKRRDLKADVIPTVFSWTKQKTRRKPPRDRASSVLASTSTAASATVTSESTVDGPVAGAPDIEVLNKGQIDHDYTDKAPSLEDQLQSAKQYIAECEAKIVTLNAEKFGLDRFAGDPKMIKFFTGFHSYALLKQFYSCISQYIPTMQTWEQFKRGDTGRKSRGLYCPKLHPIDQLFMFLHKLRLGNLDPELGDKFRVSAATVSRNITTWATCCMLFLVHNLYGQAGNR